MEAAPGPHEAAQGTKFTLELLLFQLTLALGDSILSHSPVGEQFQTLQDRHLRTCFACLHLHLFAFCMNNKRMITPMGMQLVKAQFCGTWVPFFLARLRLANHRGMARCIFGALRRFVSESCDVKTCGETICKTFYPNLSRSFQTIHRSSGVRSASVGSTLEKFDNTSVPFRRLRKE